MGSTRGQKGIPKGLPLQILHPAHLHLLAEFEELHLHVDVRGAGAERLRPIERQVEGGAAVVQLLYLYSCPVRHSLSQYTRPVTGRQRCPPPPIVSVTQTERRALRKSSILPFKSAWA
eukprot:4305732-Pyramimonas_sp.AAC.1